MYTVPFRELVSETPLDKNEVTDRAGEAGADVADEPRKVTRSVEIVAFSKFDCTHGLLIFELCSVAELNDVFSAPQVAARDPSIKGRFWRP